MGGDKNGVKMSPSEDNIFKTVIVGEGGVGKTSLIKQFVYNTFEEKNGKTLGTNVYRKDIALGIESTLKDSNLQIWDVLGQRSFTTIIKSAFKGARGVILVCDLTNKETLTRLEDWIDYAYKFGSEAAFIFLANKSDLPNHQFGLTEMKAFADRFNASYYITSAKTGANVEVAFQGIGRAIHMGKFAPSKKG